tara:strand:+ start:146 stop:349 length:204 start_codon:yes stop_codon:yes gene_type:complete
MNNIEVETETFKYTVEFGQSKSGSYHVWIIKSVKIRANCTDELYDASAVVLQEITPIIKQLNAPELI